MTSCFEYELTPVPTLLFKDGLMRKPNKAILGRTLMKESSILKEKVDCTTYVLDGGALLHRVFFKSMYQRHAQRLSTNTRVMWRKNTEVKHVSSSMVMYQHLPKITNTRGKE